MLIIQIVPKLPPAIDGLGDYALNLARQLRKDFNIKTHFIIGDPTWTGAEQIEGFPISLVNTRSADALISLLSSNCINRVLLHYVGYGYAKRGCPNWLADGLEYWRNNSNYRTLTTMFHEVYAVPRLPWTSSFWLSSLQKKLASRLVQLSDRVFTSKQGYAAILDKFSQQKYLKTYAIPVFSNVGEAKQVPPLVNRQRQMVVFGGVSKRMQVYKHCLVEIEKTCELLGIEQILDIGPSLNNGLLKTNKIPIVEMGELQPTQIQNILLNSLAGFFVNRSDNLAKSGIFAAYCAHGLLPVSIKYKQLPEDGIEPDKHYCVFNFLSDKFKNLSQMQSIANNAFNWYQSHNLSVHAKIFATKLILEQIKIAG